MEVVIVGAGSMAQTIATMINEEYNFKLEGFIGTSNEAKILKEKELYGLGKFMGNHAIIPKLYDEGISSFIVAIGDNYLREKYFYKLQEHKLNPITVISPHAVIQKNVRIGRGVCISPGVILCNGVSVGDNVVIEAGVICNVNAEIGSHSFLGSGAIIGGNVTIGRSANVGIKSYIGANVGKNNHIEIGDIILEDIADRFREK